MWYVPSIMLNLFKYIENIIIVTIKLTIENNRNRALNTGHIPLQWTGTCNYSQIAVVIHFNGKHINI